MAQQNRILSIDIFRGLTVAGMILVNNPGDWGAIYAPFKHAAWNGLTIADLVFPFFLFVMGISSYISLKNKSFEKQTILKIVKRTILLLLLGLFLNGFPEFNFSTIRIPGVLQRIAIVYFFCAITVISTNNKQRYRITGFILLVYYLLLILVPVPDLGYPSLEMKDNIPAVVDRYFMNGHLWKYSKTWDPEGILSTFSALSSGIIGIIYGEFLLSSYKEKLKISYVVSSALIIFSLLWAFHYPVNKSIWTGSYVLLTTGIGIILLITFYYLSEVKGKLSDETFFTVFGTNALAAYFFSSLLAKLLSVPFINDGQKLIPLQKYLYRMIYFPTLPHLSSLLWALCYIIFWYGILFILYRKKIIIKL